MDEHGNNAEKAHAGLGWKARTGVGGDEVGQQGQDEIVWGLGGHGKFGSSL